MPGPEMKTKYIFLVDHNIRGAFLGTQSLYTQTLFRLLPSAFNPPDVILVISPQASSKHLLGARVTAETEGPQSSGGGGETQTQTPTQPGSVFFTDRVPQYLGLESHRPEFKTQLYYKPAGWPARNVNSPL